MIFGVCKRTCAHNIELSLREDRKNTQQWRRLHDVYTMFVLPPPPKRPLPSPLNIIPVNCPLNGPSNSKTGTEGAAHTIAQQHVFANAHKHSYSHTKFAHTHGRTNTLRISVAEQRLLNEHRRERQNVENVNSPSLRVILPATWSILGDAAKAGCCRSPTSHITWSARRRTNQTG